MTNVKITYAYASEYNQEIPNNGFSCETDYIVTDGLYSFEDYLRDNGVYFEHEDDLYFVLYNLGDERTGEVFMVLREEETDEELYGTFLVQRW